MALPLLIAIIACLAGTISYHHVQKIHLEYLGAAPRLGPVECEQLGEAALQQTQGADRQHRHLGGAPARAGQRSGGSSPLVKRCAMKKQKATALLAMPKQAFLLWFFSIGHGIFRVWYFLTNFDSSHLCGPAKAGSMFLHFALCFPKDCYFVFFRFLSNVFLGQGPQNQPQLET